MNFRLLLITIVLVAFLLPVESRAAGPGNALLRSTERRLIRTVRPKIPRSGIFELERDYGSVKRTLKRPRLVDRYTSSSRAADEAAHGIAPYRHMTSVSTKRPLTTLNAQKRLGLSMKPQVVERVRLSKGTPLKFNKVIGGKPGYGEITVPSRMPSSAIIKQLRLR